ncbi:MAG: VWA domain-containing protein [Piscinibacter sp.]|uniref:VWA domain-containing protein n=1 Tax=Piscinibacter sp. TaxID=1903157 RepID=UPI00258CDEA2|nr:VWA domain-containing protein [Piscinibacter sp.]MCW5667734.1 VWA domain-containing protein [Piscinibacter sp.]
MNLDAPYDRLEALPRTLWLPALVCSAGRSEARLAQLRPWAEALERGELPAAALDFADPEALAPLRACIGALGLPALARGVPALAEQVLRTLLWHLDRIVDHQPALSRAEAITRAAGEFHAEWQVQTSGWEEQLALLRDLGDLATLRWDELRGRLAAREWQEARRLAALLEHLQPLAALIERLGRSEHAPDAPPAEAPHASPAAPRVPLAERVTRLPDAPGELRGIRHSGRLERMLGSEAMQIRHPVLHKLWRARLAESRLLTYESEALLVERVPDPSGRTPAAARDEAQPLQRGPMILAVDTSGSMRGAPENIAKAAVLQALRVAQRERRGCLLIAFGGPGELVERELRDERDPAAGLDALFELLGQSFDGGTDVQAPIERAVARVHEARWRSADLLIVSDGEFGCTPATLAALDDARRTLGLRVQGILVGDRETLGLLDSCDEVFWLRDWRRYGDAVPQREAFVPVHTASLTALYFPNALRPHAAATAARRPGKP